MISGGIWGALISVIVLVLTSLNSEPPPGNRPPLAPATTVPELPDDDIAPASGGGDAIPGGSTDAGGAPTPSDTPEVSSPGETPASIAALPDADTAPPAVPRTGDADRAIAEPAAPRSAPVLGGGGDEPVSIIADTEAPPAPEVEAAPQADQASADPVAAPAEVAAEAPGLATPDADDRAPGIDSASSDDAPEAATRPVAPSEPAEIATDPTLDEAPETAPLPQAETEIALAPEPAGSLEEPASPRVVESDSLETDRPAIAPPAIDDLPPASPDDPSPDGSAVLVEVPDAPDAPEGEPTLRVEEVPAEEADGPLITLRGSEAALPSGSAEIRVIRPDDAGGETGESEEPVIEAIDPDAPALVAHASRWEPEVEGRPLMSVILMDEGGLGSAGVAAVAAIPFPVSVAIDATRPDAAERLAAYREAGFEVLAIARLPDGATPQDADVILSAALDAVPQTIALLDPGDGGLQGDQQVTELVMGRLADGGRGFITASRGLNTALRVAEAEGVAAEVLYRDLDDDGQDARVIRRFLDQAAFRARQQSGVVLLARVRPDTISALTLWGTANRASQVDLAPVSAVLTRQ